jgi:hypothetical protein
MMAGGTYKTAMGSNGYDCLLAGTAAAPIIFRATPGQRVTVDGHGTEFVFICDGAYVWFWGIEFLDSNGTRTSTTTDPEGICWGIAWRAPGVRHINCIIHDTMQGISAYDNSPDCVAHGNLVYYNGIAGTPRNAGHGMYMQNVTSLKHLEENFVGDNALEGMQIYGSGAAHVVGFRVNDNTLYSTSSWPVVHYQYNMVYADGSDRSDCQMDGNWSYFPPEADYGFFNLGQYTDGADVSFTNGVCIGGYIGPNINRQSGPINFQNNRVVVNTVQADGTPICIMQWAPGSDQTPVGVVIDNNQYFGNPRFRTGTMAVDSSGNDAFSGTLTDFSGWQGAGFDMHSTFVAALPTGQWTKVVKNAYESKRANVTVVNWDLASTVQVDLSSILAVGDTYVVQDAQNFFGPPVLSATYDGKPVTLPATGLTKATLIGSITPPHTAPKFLTFVVLGPSVDIIPPLPYGVSPVAVSLGPGQTQQFVASLPSTWSISPATGSIDANGLYTAPASIATQATVTVTATAGTQSVNAVITLLTSAPPPPPPPKNKFNIGDGVQVNPGNALNVRANPDPTLTPIGSEAAGKQGVVRAGPVTAGGYIFYQIQWVDGIFGWSVQDYMTKLPAPPPLGLIVTPLTAALTSGQTQQFTASEASTWAISPSLGTIDTTGLYTAPASITVGSTVTVTATAGTQSASAVVTLEAMPPPPPVVYHWHIAKGSPPPGLVMYSSGKLSGIPTAPGTYYFKVHVVDNQTPQNSGQLEVSMTIIVPPPPPPTGVLIVDPGQPLTGIVGVEYTFKFRVD